ncbi:uncharacterized protein V1516DRAFT_663213 [Lipomyces oligophaga]|uniref:uncharacterized protein n=1 Tax=Lipomyces oligophaga TaxID=45792 RepID=UPI0034CE4531
MEVSIVVSSPYDSAAAADDEFTSSPSSSDESTSMRSSAIEITRNESIATPSQLDDKSLLAIPTEDGYFAVYDQFNNGVISDDDSILDAGGISGGSILRRPMTEDYEDDYNLTIGDSHRTVMYGWIVLASTWAVFIIGIGSVFGVWNWVWAPMVQLLTGRSRLMIAIDDETEFPVDEYYPAIVVLACVVAWIWCIVSWVGMKLFRHAKGGVSTDISSMTACESPIRSK